MKPMTSSPAIRDTQSQRLAPEWRTEPGGDIRVNIVTHGSASDNVFIPAVPEPVIAWVASGSALVEQREPEGHWRQVRVFAGDFYLKASPGPADMRWHAESADDFALMRVQVGLPLLARAVRGILEAPLDDFALRDVQSGQDPILSGLLELLYPATRAGADGNNGFVQGVGQALAAHLVKNYGRRAKGRWIARGGLPGHKLGRIIDMMRASLDEPFNLQLLAARAELSAFHFSRVFKQATGMAPSRYFVHLRMQEARRLLSETDRSIIDIALALGYRSPSHFSCVFRQVTSITPSAYRDGVWTA
jgi:AraC family transcriptional regulator